MKTTTYSVIVNDPNSWHTDGTPVELRRCDHKHRSLRAAHKCMDRLVDYQPGGTHSAAWHNASVRRSDNTPLTEDEGYDLSMFEAGLEP